MLTFSRPIGKTYCYPFACEYCHKQYADKAKLNEHKRSKHPEHAETDTIPVVRTDKLLEHNLSDHVLSGELTSNQDVVTLLQTITENSDLLTHAMSVNDLQSPLNFQQTVS
ncbi:hypothetical protein EB796_002292 [Bugula neritina]|uniref:C2H2-type domain-containing protein n=1 Tax=Bugula neritina TaxID=10212 RepID=A0A7J7KMN0_BUGNE|nr:hypothetical protein EB796_002292 [Bugula neritina]